MMVIKIRRNQLITTWGIGNIIDLPKDRSGLVAGLDYWTKAYVSVTDGHNQNQGPLLAPDYIIHDERLESYLHVKEFRMPMDYRKRGPYQYKHMPLIDFPLWKFCPRCGYLYKVPYGQIKHEKKNLQSRIVSECNCPGKVFENGTVCSESKGRKRRLIPVRFVTYCDHGHLDDFPFDEWVQHEVGCERNSGYRMIIGAGSDLSNIKIRCNSCGGQRSMRDAFSDRPIREKCNGRKPWLGEDAKDDCNKPMYAAIRGAGKIYHAKTVSALFLPPKIDDGRIPELVERHWKTMRLFMDIISESSNENRDKKEIIEAGIQVLKKYSGLNDIDLIHDQLYGYIENKITDPEMKTDKEYDSLKEKEYHYLMQSRVSVSELKLDRLSSELLKDYAICNLAQVIKIRETIAFAGFSRGGYGGSVLDLHSMMGLISNRPVEWLPAIVNYGEGIFFSFDKNALEEWENKESTDERFKVLAGNYEKSSYKIAGKSITPRFIFLHTLSHMMISRLAFISGYSAASIRERIYCNTENDSEFMAGILLYTASGDSEGSLGGLVRQAKQENLKSIMEGAIDQAGWCSADPVCMESAGQGPDGLNLAACHNCVLLPETSCEFSNRLLDRAMVVGSHCNPEIGFYSKFAKIPQRSK